MRSFMLKLSYLRVHWRGYLELEEQVRRSQQIQMWHYEGSKFYMCKHSFHRHSNYIIWVQLSPDILHLTPIFSKHYEEIILLRYPVRQTKPTVVCIPLLFKLPNKSFSGFTDQGHFQEESSGGTSGRGRIFA